MNIRFMVKYGEKGHLEQLIGGKIRFAPAKTYIEIEETQHQKGQGDLLEGKMKIKAERMRIFHPETNELIQEVPSCVILWSTPDVKRMPVFCLSQYDDSSIQDYKDDENYTIAIPEEKLAGIRVDFPKATHALVILDPDEFINDVQSIPDHRIVGDSIRYYDYDINPLQMFMFLSSGDETVQTGGPFTMTYEDKFRLLLRKDKDFSKQDEYRFIGIEEIIDEPEFYDFKLTSRYLLVPIEQLKQLPIKM